MKESKAVLCPASALPRVAIVGALAIPISIGAAVGEVALDDVSYRTHCASCHGSDFGGGFGPALIGRTFREKWAGSPAGALLAYIKTKMPPAMPGSLASETYVAVHDSVAGANELPLAKAALASVRSSASVATELRREAARALFTAGVLDAYAKTIADARKALIEKVSPVTDAVLRHPPDGDWLMWRRTLDTLGYSPLKQIDRSNVDQLKLAWSVSLKPGTNGIAPLVHDGVMFLNASGTVMALDAATGDVLWEYAGAAGLSARAPLSQPRTIALYGDRVYVPTLNGRILALDVRSGALLWEHEIFRPEDPLALTAGPLVVRGKIIQGVSGCAGMEYPGGCYIVALDAVTGKESWRFHTIPRPNELGGDSWNGAEMQDRFGGSVWTTGSYDPDLNLVYLGASQTYKISPLLQSKPRRGESADALFTDSTLALDPDSGKLKWYYQHLASDVWNLEWAFERMLITLPEVRGPRKVVLTGGKIALFDALDARTGRYLFSLDSGVQNLVQSIDPRTGRKHINPAVELSTDRAVTVCPHMAAGKSWPSASYNPSSRLLFVPLIDTCMEMRFVPHNPKSSWNEWDYSKKSRPDGDDKFGRVTALNLDAQQVVWTNRRRAPQVSAMLATAGGLVFEGSSDRRFRALDEKSGETLWETPLNEMPNGFPISFSVGAEQYVAIIAGGGTVIDIAHRRLTPEIQSSNGARTLWVFKLHR